jgi:putative transposase
MNIGQKRSRAINTLCLLLGYSRQAYYQQKKATEKESLQNELIIQQVLFIRTRQKRIGVRKLFVMLQPFFATHHISIGRDALFELLAAHNLLVRRRKRKIPRTTFSDHWMRKYPNLIIGMPVKRPNRLWVSDITYITLAEGPAYLALVTDAYSRMIVGYSLNRNLCAEGCVKALQMAINQLPETADLIHHSDRGSQYCSFEYVEQLTGKHIAISMTQNSDPRENAIAERVNGIIKQEFLEVSYASFSQASEGVKDAIGIYNHERPHSSLDMLTPVNAHATYGELKRHWKNYYPQKRKEVCMG